MNLSPPIFNGGNEEEAREVFQESLIILACTIREGRFREGPILKNYSVAVAKQYWYGVIERQVS